MSLDAAVDQVTDDTTTDTSEAATSAIEGTWTVDTETGAFDFESATGTFAGFRVQEALETGVFPTAPVVLGVEDEFTLELQFLAT